ncbi:MULTISPECIES: DEAD/DEAH box helicase [unclassified Cryobacterium]|uniref:DEAD/DEAH box helicase n=1 Tax=unclassified Cryobacterium TaxID=2649013 RepID=UPI000CE3BDE6|nr:MULTISPECIES: DEAD/DEAH box helicase [unclassified Cryobacterium]
MPQGNSHNSTVGRNGKNFDPKYSKGGSGHGGSNNAGSKSPGHRGYRADEGAPKKQRWNADERAARSNERPSSERPAYGSRSVRPENGGRTNSERNERPAYNNDRPRTDRPSYNNDRPSYGDRNSAPRTERPSYGDRAPRSDRPAYNNDRPAYGDRNSAPRTERPSYGDRAPRSDRPAYNNDRPAYNNDRPARTERPSYGDRAPRTDRPAYNNDRPARTERPSYGDRAERAPRRDFGNDRPSDGDSKFYPKRSEHGAKPSFAGGDDVVLERLEAIATTASDVVGVTFGDLGLGENIVRELAALGAPSPFPIQAATIPDVLAGRDVLGRGKTGSGKTIAFGAPLVEKLMENNGAKDRKMARKPRALILAPTRELALQIDRTVQPIARSVGLFTTQIYGGVPQYRQVSALQRGVDIIIGTAGRIEDLIDQGRLDLSEVVVTVLDEADYMCDLGFLEPVQRILRQTKAGGQKLLFSATLDKGVASLVKEFLTNPAVHEVAGEDQASSTIDHRVLVIEHRDKGRIIEELVNREGKTLIFSRTRAYAEQLADQLEDAGVKATSLHGDLNQARRTRNLQMLTSGRVNVLVATDVAARGIHVDDIDLVIQADAPDEYKTYLHRAGRTGRAGKTGTVVTLIPKQRKRRMDELLDRAEIDASYTSATPGDAAVRELASI